MVQDARVEREAAALAKVGYLVTVLCRQLAPQQALREDRRGFHIVRMPSWSAKLSERWILQWLRDMEFSLRAFLLAWRSHGNVYHAHDLDTLLPIYLAARLMGVPIVYDAHELFNERTRIPKWGYWARLERFLLPRMHGIIAANQERAEVMRDEYGAPSLPVVIENMPDWQEIAPNTLLRDFVVQSGQNWKHIVLYQGAIRSGRSIEVVLRAVALMSGDCGVVFLGPVSERYKAQLVADAKSLSVTDRILFHPSLPYHRLLRYTVSATVGLALYENTSRNNYLCAPNKIYEYMMVGVPVVASNFPPIQRLFRGHDLGELVEPSSPRSIADAVNQLLADEERRRAIQTTARQLSRDVYNFERIAGRLINLYQVLVKNGASKT